MAGEPHIPTFVTTASVAGKQVTSKSFPTKKQSEHNAAELLYHIINPTTCYVVFAEGSPIVNELGKSTAEDMTLLFIYRGEHEGIETKYYSDDFYCFRVHKIPCETPHTAEVIQKMVEITQKSLPAGHFVSLVCK